MFYIRLVRWTYLFRVRSGRTVRRLVLWPAKNHALTVLPVGILVPVMAPLVLVMAPVPSANQLVATSEQLEPHVDRALEPSVSHSKRPKQARSLSVLVDLSLILCLTSKAEASESSPVTTKVIVVRGQSCRSMLSLDLITPLSLPVLQGKRGITFLKHNAPISATPIRATTDQLQGDMSPRAAAHAYQSSILAGAGLIPVRHLQGLDLLRSVT